MSGLHLTIQPVDASWLPVAWLPTAWIKISRDDELVLLTAAGNIPFRLDDMFQHNSSKPLQVAPDLAYQVDILLPTVAQNQLTGEALDKGLLVRNLATEQQ
jgi:hypothetical protein